MTKPVIVFVGSVYPGQFGGLCDYLRKSGVAETYFLTTPGHRARNVDRGAHILAFQPDGKIVGEQSYYYSAKVERSARIGRGVLNALREFQSKKKIDVVVSHSLFGAPHFLYDEIDAAIISYIEFPSYQAHGWDPTYPPDLAQRMADKNTEMLNFHQAVRSDLVICPSHHAKQMFPRALQGNIEVQLEGFDFETNSHGARAKASDAPFTIGFAARDLSSAKGFDTYMGLVSQLIDQKVEARFIALGGAGVTTYGYEEQWVRREHNGAIANFCEHLKSVYPQAGEAVEFAGTLPYEEYTQRIADIDLFLYPLKYGVANWGLVEILGRGACVIAPDSGYPTELIIDDVNGCLLPDEDAAWISAIKALMEDPDRRKRYGAAARIMSIQHHSYAAVTPRYMQLFRKAMQNRKMRNPS